MIKQPSKKHEQIKVSNLENHCFPLRKTYISQTSRFLNWVEKVTDKVIKNHEQINQKSIDKSIQNRGAEKYRKMIPT